MIKDGLVSWAIRHPGPGGKSYAIENRGEGIVWHSMEGSYVGSLSVLQGPAKSSWMFSLRLNGELVQHYPIWTSCWASGNREANTLYWSVELEGTAAMPINNAQAMTALRLIDEWETYSGLSPVRKVSMWEHREVATKWTPNAGPTACPSERYASLWVGLAEEEPEVTREEYEHLILAVFSGAEEDHLPYEQRLANALYRVSQRALTAPETEWSRSVADVAQSAQENLGRHESEHPVADHKHRIQDIIITETGGVI